MALGVNSDHCLTIFQQDRCGMAKILSGLLIHDYLAVSFVCDVDDRDGVAFGL